ncbi:von Willebrand factor type A domain-containing protein [Oribacterium sp. KHPX15]|uniref:FHA domain-containing protein n=1 Tax=unclassified Oribacterium TaxID=2629782 RepID=UPI00067894D4|nr:MULTISPECIES: FHA domain-containing protein [unclassified Oribacterium]SDZ97539.1 von Willebrand factor type A domain-containing protein [Oribacterium sp. KHPX15]
MKKLQVFLITFFMLLLCVTEAFAAENGTILAKETDGQNLVLYVQSTGDIESVEAQVGTVKASSVDVKLSKNGEVPIDTLILIDNSLSISKKYRPQIIELATNIAANHISNETITVATFSNNINYLVEKSNDYTAVKSAIDGIEFQNQDTYLTDCLYNIFSSLSANPDGIFHRIIVVSDGASEEDLGYTMQEVKDLINKTQYPIYAFGCSGKNNKNELENMFSLSRQTNGKIWKMDDIQSVMDPVKEISLDNDIARISLTLPDDVMDGSEKGVLLSMNIGGQAITSETRMNMPFSEGKQVVEETTVRETEKETRETIEETEAEDEGQMDIMKYIPYIGAAFFAVLLIVAGIVFFVASSKKKAERDKVVPTPEGAGSFGSGLAPSYSTEDEKTVMVDDSYGLQGDRTAMFLSESPVKTLVLEDISNPVRHYEVPLTGKVVIGRSQKGDCQLVIDEKSVSHRHCEIYDMNGELYISDLGSRNGTNVNGARIVGQVKLSLPSSLKLGNNVFKIEVR